MAVVLRLKRIGRRNRPFYRICAMDRQTRRDGRAIEELGHYSPVDPEKGKHFQLNAERIVHWLSVGAQPSETVLSFIKEAGIDVAAARRGEAVVLPVAAPEAAPETASEAAPKTAPAEEVAEAAPAAAEESAS
jgi:small subunit ribosomal protein S16